MRNVLALVNKELLRCDIKFKTYILVNLSNSHNIRTYIYNILQLFL
jgi:hypothetical protein